MHCAACVFAHCAFEIGPLFSSQFTLLELDLLLQMFHVPNLSFPHKHRKTDRKTMSLLLFVSEIVVVAAVVYTVCNTGCIQLELTFLASSLP